MRSGVDSYRMLKAIKRRVDLITLGIYPVLIRGVVCRQRIDRGGGGYKSMS